MNYLLTDIQGIGPGTAKKLEARGITSVQHLAGCEFSTIADIRGADPDWIAQAHELLGMTVDPGRIIGFAESDLPRLVELRDRIAAKKHLPALSLGGALKIVINGALVEAGIEPLD